MTAMTSAELSHYAFEVVWTGTYRAPGYADRGELLPPREERTALAALIAQSRH